MAVWSDVSQWYSFVEMRMLSLCLENTKSSRCPWLWVDSETDWVRLNMSMISCSFLELFFFYVFKIKVKVIEEADKECVFGWRRTKGNVKQLSEGDAAERWARRLRGRHGHWVEKVVRKWCVDTRQSEGGELNWNGKSQARQADDRGLDSWKNRMEVDHENRRSLWSSSAHSSLLFSIGVAFCARFSQCRDVIDVRSAGGGGGGGGEEGWRCGSGFQRQKVMSSVAGDRVANNTFFSVFCSSQLLRSTAALNTEHAVTEHAVTGSTWPADGKQCKTESRVRTCRNRTRPTVLTSSGSDTQNWYHDNGYITRNNAIT